MTIRGLIRSLQPSDDDPLAPLSEEARKKAEDLLGVAESTQESLLSGLEGLAHVMATAAHAETGEEHNWNLADCAELVATVAEMIDGFRMLEDDLSRRLALADLAELRTTGEGQAKAGVSSEEAQKPAEAARDPSAVPSPPGPDLKDEFRQVHQGLIRLSNDLGILSAYHQGKLPERYIDGRQLARMFATEGYEASGQVLEDLDRLMDKAGIGSLYKEPLESEEAA